MGRIWQRDARLVRGAVSVASTLSDFAKIKFGTIRNTGLDYFDTNKDGPNLEWLEAVVKHLD